MKCREDFVTNSSSSSFIFHTNSIESIYIMYNKLQYYAKEVYSMLDEIKFNSPVEFKRLLEILLNNNNDDDTWYDFYLKLYKNNGFKEYIFKLLNKYGYKKYYTKLCQSYNYKYSYKDYQNLLFDEIMDSMVGSCDLSILNLLSVLDLENLLIKQNNIIFEVNDIYLLDDIYMLNYLEDNNIIINKLSITLNNNIPRFFSHKLLCDSIEYYCE